MDQQQTEALGRVKESLAACIHPRGQNWTPRVIEEEDDDGKPVRVHGVRNPCIELASCDIAALCDAVPAEKRDQIVKDLRRGQRGLAEKVPPIIVAIHVDDAHHLVDLAEGREPPPHNRFGLKKPAAKTRPDGTPVPTIGEVKAQQAQEAAKEHDRMKAVLEGGKDEEQKGDAACPPTS